jgi:hypothetical protein
MRLSALAGKVEAVDIATPRASAEIVFGILNIDKSSLFVRDANEN